MNIKHKFEEKYFNNKSNMISWIKNFPLFVRLKDNPRFE